MTKHVKALRAIAGVGVQHDHWAAAQIAADHLERTERRLAVARKAINAIIEAGRDGLDCYAYDVAYEARGKMKAVK